MKTLIIYAHPNTPGHCSYILEQVKAKLDTKEYEILDLYKIKYDPVLHENELYTAGGEDISKQDLEIQNKIKRSNHLIFIYPVWWGSMPAILKGFFDKVFKNGFAFKFKDKKGVGLLKDKTATIFITSGASKLVYLLFLGNIPKKIIKRLILGFCGIKSKFYHIGNCTIINEKKKQEIKKVVNKALNEIR